MSKARKFKFFQKTCWWPDPKTWPRKRRHHIFFEIKSKVSSLTHFIDFWFFEFLTKCQSQYTLPPILPGHSACSHHSSHLDGPCITTTPRRSSCRPGKSVRLFYILLQHTRFLNDFYTISLQLHLYMDIHTLTHNSALSESTKLTEKSDQSEVYRKLRTIYDKVSTERRVPFAEYRIVGYFVIGFGTLVLVLVGSANTCGEEEAIHPDAGSVCVRDPQSGELPADCVCQYWGILLDQRSSLRGEFRRRSSDCCLGIHRMRIAVFANARTALSVKTTEFKEVVGLVVSTAFRAGSVMGFSLCGLALLVLYFLIRVFNVVLPFDDDKHGAWSSVERLRIWSRRFLDCNVRTCGWRYLHESRRCGCRSCR